MQRVNKAVFQKLKALLPAGTSVFPAVADEDAKYPYVVYNMDSFTTDADKDSDTREASYTIEIWNDDFDECDKLSDLIDEGLRGVIAPGVQSFINNGTSGYAGAFFSKLVFDLEID